MSTALISLAFMCIAAFAIGTFCKIKSKITGVLLLGLLLSAPLTIALVSSKENIPFLDAFSKLLTFEAYADRASLGLYAVLILFFFGVGARIKRVEKNAT